MALENDAQLKETTLTPEVRRIRNSIIKKFAHEPLDTMAKFVKDVMDNEQDTVRRLGAMAARVEILRMRILQISNTTIEPNFDELTEDVKDESVVEEDSNDIVITSPNLSDWVRLRIMENSEINGVRFPKGVVIDVSQEDGDRLLESGKASYVEEDEIADVKSDVNLQKKSKQKVSHASMEPSTDIDEENLKAEDINPSSDVPNEFNDKNEVLNTDSTADELSLEGEAENLEKMASTKKKKLKSDKIKSEVKNDASVETSDDIIEPIEGGDEVDGSKSPSPEEMLAGFDLDTKE